jgi:hypothetical protein
MPSPVSIRFDITNLEQEEAVCKWRLVAGVDKRKKYENNGFLGIRAHGGLIVNVNETLSLSRVLHLLREVPLEEIPEGLGCPE